MRNSRRIPSVRRVPAKPAFAFAAAGSGAALNGRGGLFGNGGTSRASSGSGGLLCSPAVFPSAGGLFGAPAAPGSNQLFGKAEEPVKELHLSNSAVSLPAQ